MSQRPGSPMGRDFGSILRGPFGGGTRRMPRPPIGRGTFPGGYDDGRGRRNMPMPPINRGPIFRPGRPRPPIYSPGGPNKGGTQAPIPRFPSRGSGASNFYRNPSYSYGVPTGLGALLSGQQSPFGRMVDPATGFPQRSSPRPVMGRPDFGQIGRSTSSGKSGSKGGAKTVRSPDQGRETNRQPQPDIGMNPFPGGYDDDRTRSSQIPRDILDRGTVMNPAYRSQGPESLMGRDFQVSDVFMDAVESAPLLGNNPPPSPTQGLSGVQRRINSIRPDLIPRRPARSVSQTPEESLRQRALAGNRRGTGLDLPPVSPSDVQQQIMRQIQMEQDGGRPNIRPTMNVGKATGGPVGIHSGIASLVGRR